jgi:hypothetical protein
MNFIEALLGGLIGAGGGAGQALKGAKKKGKKPDGSVLGALQGMGQSRLVRPTQAPSDRFFPGNTNFGVPQDNMIDTSMGYMTPPQFDQVMNSAMGERGYMNPVQGGGSLYRPDQFSLQGGSSPLNDQRRRLRVR